MRPLVNIQTANQVRKITTQRNIPPTFLYDGSLTIVNFVPRLLTSNHDFVNQSPLRSHSGMINLCRILSFLDFEILIFNLHTALGQSQGALIAIFWSASLQALASTDGLLLPHTFSLDAIRLVGWLKRVILSLSHQPHTPEYHWRRRKLATSMLWLVPPAVHVP